MYRDLKPANILLTLDGQPKITDFGLAKRLSENSQWTQTDTVMGTPHYMAPEQARGDSQAVGPLADVYSLGTILYELLTGKPPFTDSNIAELLGKICTDPPKPLRKHDPQIPKDLETICLRCLEKEDIKRYASAEDLAEDLERFLENRPIAARAVGPAERLVKWVHRRPATAAMLLGLVLLLMVIGIGGVAYHLRLRQERDRAESNFQLANAAVDEILTDLDEENFLVEPHFEERRQKLLKTALKFTQQLAEQKPENLDMQRNLGFCHRRSGDIHRILGENEEGEQSYQKAIALLTELRNANPNDREVTHQLAKAHGFLGELKRGTSQIEQAQAAYASARELYLELLQADPNQTKYQMEYARTLSNTGILQKDTAGTGEDREEKLDQAFRSHTEAIALLVPLVRNEPDNRHYTQHLARSYINLGSVMRAQLAWRKGQTPFREAIALLKDLSNRYPNFSEYRYELALAHNNFGNLLSSGKQHHEAALQLQLAESAFLDLVNAHPKIPIYRRELANNYNSLAVVNYRLKNTKETREAWTKSIEQLTILLMDSPGVPDYEGTLGITQANLGRLELRAHRPQEALASLLASLPHLKAAWKANPNYKPYTSSLQQTYRDLASLFVQEGKINEAIQTVDGLLTESPPAPLDAQLAAIFSAKVIEEIPNPTEFPRMEEFQQRARAAAESYQNTEEGATDLKTAKGLAPLRELIGLE